MREIEQSVPPGEFRKIIGELFPNGFLISGKRLAGLFSFPGLEKISPDELNGLTLLTLQKLTSITFEGQEKPKIYMTEKQQALFYFYFGQFPEVDEATKEVTSLSPPPCHDYLSLEKAAKRVGLNPFIFRQEQRKLQRSILLTLCRYSLLDYYNEKRDLYFDTLSKGYLLVNNDSGFSVIFIPEEEKVIKEKEVISPAALVNRGWRSVSSITKGSQEGEYQLALRGFRGQNVPKVASFLENQGIRIKKDINPTNNGITYLVAPEDTEKAKSLLRSLTLK